MKSIIVKLIGVTALFAAFTGTAATVEAGVSPILTWGNVDHSFTVSDNDKPEEPPKDKACDGEQGGIFSYTCIRASARDPSGRLAKWKMSVWGNSIRHVYTHTSRISTNFTVGGADGSEKTIPAMISGLVVSSGTIASNAGAAEGWVDYNVKVEIFKMPTNPSIPATLVAGTDVVSEHCAGTLGQIGFIGPCRIVISSQTPVSIPVLLTEGSQYDILVTSSCTVQGPGTACYGPVFTDFSRGLETEVVNFIVNVASSTATQDSVDALLDSNQLLMQEVCALSRFRSAECQAYRP